MEVATGGIDIFYIDESHDATSYVVTAIAVPFMRPIDGKFHLVWDDYRERSAKWRSSISQQCKIPVSKELHGSHLAKRRGNYKFGNRQLTQEEVDLSYSFCLSQMDFLPDGSVMSVCGGRGQKMYDSERLLRVMHALFQRMRLQCRSRKVNAMTFFDEGHDEYRSLYRKAQRHLLSGSFNGEAKNRPLDMFTKDGNFKNSKFCRFIQMADLISYAALQKFRVERGEDPKSLGNMPHYYEKIPKRILNLSVSKSSNDGILRLG